MSKIPCGGFGLDENFLGMNENNELSLAGGGEGDKFKQLVTDGEGKVKWEDRTHFSTTVESTVLMEEQELIFNDEGFKPLPVTIDLIEGKLYTVVFDGVSYECKCALFRGQYPYIGNPAGFGEPSIADTGEPFLYVPTEGNQFMVINNSNPSHTVGIYGDKEFVHKIDEKYLPDPLILYDLRRGV